MLSGADWEIAFICVGSYSGQSIFLSSVSGYLTWGTEIANESIRVVTELPTSHPATYTFFNSCNKQSNK